MSAQHRRKATPGHRLAWIAVLVVLAMCVPKFSLEFGTDGVSAADVNIVSTPAPSISTSLQIASMPAPTTSADVNSVSTPAPSIAASAAKPTTFGEVLVARYGYTRVPTVDADGHAYGYVYVNCGTERDLTVCSENRHTTATAGKPNVYLSQDERGLLRLEGPHVKILDNSGSEIADGLPRNYCVTVPAEHSSFASLSASELNALLTRAVAEVIKAVAKSDTWDPLEVPVRGLDVPVIGRTVPC